MDLLSLDNLPDSDLNYMGNCLKFIYLGGYINLTRN